MNAPDKVYVSIGYEAQTKPFHTSVEYIRKDALPEWANLRKEELKSEDAAAIKDDIRYGADAAFDTLIEKLNSM